MSRRRLHIAPLCFALLALAWAQVFGLVRGYLCDCGGQAEITLAEHCHGPHSVACHEAAPDVDQDCDKLPSGDGTQHHDLVKETVQAKPQAQALVVPAMAVLLIAELPEWTVTSLMQTASLVRGSETRLDGDARLRQWPQVLARTIALRI